MALLADALARCRRAAELSDGKMLVGLSGGKDSLATLDVVIRSGAFSRVEALAMELVPNLDCFRGPVLRAAERYQVPVHFVPHWDLSRLLKFAVLRPHIHGVENLRLQKIKDVERALTHRTGIDFFCYGERAADSIVRRIYTRECDGVQAKWRRLWPIWDWKTKELLAYLKARRITPPRKAKDGRVSSGIDLQPRTLAYLKKHHPADFAKVLEVFPWAGLQIFRLERGDFEKPPKTASE